MLIEVRKDSYFMGLDDLNGVWGGYLRCWGCFRYIFGNILSYVGIFLYVNFILINMRRIFL